MFIMIVRLTVIQIIVDNSRIPLWSVYIKNGTQYTKFVNTKRTWVTFITRQNVKLIIMLKLLRTHPILLPNVAYGIVHFCCVLIEDLYIKDFHFSETLKRQSLKIWSHSNPFTCKLTRLRKDNYYSGVTAL